jgi:Leucine-rich repeat (LRR) protein
MRRKHKFYNIEELNFVRFATVYYLDIMVWEQYFSESSEERKFLNLSGNSITHVPEETYELQNLQYINLSGNKLTDSTKRELKEKLKNITLIL